MTGDGPAPSVTPISIDEKMKVLRNGGHRQALLIAGTRCQRSYLLYVQDEVGKNHLPSNDDQKQGKQDDGGKADTLLDGRDRPGETADSHEGHQDADTHPQDRAGEEADVQGVTDVAVLLL